ncbi:hypothetical protein AURDEDRAFT_141378 [Auricularia subglabra TFB-10046 SS5]|nr:hypothetical protein AURDEDRAFT_141378 [Auricularia subglabra TFB-10046 SS5]
MDEPFVPAEAANDQPKHRARLSRFTRHLLTLLDDWTKPTLGLQNGSSQSGFGNRVRLLGHRQCGTVFAARFRRTWRSKDANAEKFHFETVGERDAFVKSTSVLVHAKDAHVH